MLRDDNLGDGIVEQSVTYVRNTLQGVRRTGTAAKGDAAVDFPED